MLRGKATGVYGEVGYSELDYRSRSNAPNAVLNTEVEVVEERLVLDIGLDDFAELDDMDEKLFWGDVDEEQI